MGEQLTDEQVAILKMSGQDVPTQEGVDNPPPVEPQDTPPNENEPVVEWEKITGGRIKTSDEWANLIKDYDESKPKYGELETKHNALQQEYDKIKNRNPFEGNEELYRISELSKQTGIKDYGLIGQIINADPEKMDNLSIIKFAKIIEDPDWKDDMNLLDKSLSKQYKLEKPEDYEDLTDAEKEEIDLKIDLAKRQIKSDAKKAREVIENWKNKVKLPEIETQEQKQKKNEDRIAKWQEPFKKVSEDLKTISVKAEVGKDRKVLEINVDVPEDEIKAAVSQEIAEYIVKSGLEVNEKTMKHLQDLSVQWYKLKNENLIYGKIAEAARLMTDEEWKKRTGISGGKDKPIDGGGSEQTDEQKAIERIKSGK